MKAISLWQPWAHAMKICAKQNETRSWHTNYRGDLLICSAKSGLSKEECHAQVDALMPTTELYELQFGYGLCVVELYDCVSTDDISYDDYCYEEEFGDYSPGRFVWMTRNHRSIVPFPVKGRQGLFNVDDSLIRYFGEANAET